MITLIIFLSFLFFVSEFILMLVKRSKKDSTKHQKDRGTLIMLWVMITLCFTLGFMFANYGVWDSVNFIAAYIGLSLISAGLIIRWYSIIKLKKAFTVDVSIGQNHKLETGGIYRYIRHPSYLGLLLIMTGFAIGMNSLISLVLTVIPLFISILIRISVEEKLLVEEFGDSYIHYQKTTKKLIPGVI